MAVQYRRDGGNHTDAAFPDLGYAGAKISPKTAVMDLPQLAENNAALLALRAQHGREVLDQENGITVRREDVVFLRCRSQLLQQPRIFVPVESAEKGILGDIADGLDFLQSARPHDAHGSFAAARGCHDEQPRRCANVQVGTATLSNGAHLNFVVVASAQQIQFIQTDANMTISGSAEQVFPQQSSTTVSGGSMAQVASGGGWQTIFTLVNTGTSSAQAQLSFFDNNGNPLSLPLTFADSGATTTSSSLSETIGAEDTLVLVASGTNSAQVGSAQLSIDGKVGGFAIFHYNPTGQEAVVPLETTNATAYVLAFDNTNGLATGLALANVSNQSGKVTLIVRDDNGSKLGTATINLPARGHTSFMLGSTYSFTANKRGTVEFDTPPNGQISALGLRASPTGSLTTIPVLVK